MDPVIRDWLITNLIGLFAAVLFLTVAGFVSLAL